MKTLEGNLIELAKSGHFDLIAHGANCFCTFGAGIALAIKKAFPEAYSEDLKTQKGAIEKLGTFSLCECHLPSGKTLKVANLYTQYFWGGPSEFKDSSEVRYNAIRKSLESLKKAIPENTRIGLPRIGAGLAGGDWDKISQIIEEIFPEASIVQLPEFIEVAKKNVSKKFKRAKTPKL